jgi:hypothetical protein
MEPKYITFEQAKWLKEKGFDNIECDGYYHINEGYTIGYAFCHSERDEQFDNSILSPKQHQVVDWLRVNHDIWVGVMPDVGMDLIYTYKIYSVEVGVERGLANGNNYDTPQDAYSSAFDYIMEFIM